MSEHLHHFWQTHPTGQRPGGKQYAENLTIQVTRPTSSIALTSIPTNGSPWRSWLGQDRAYPSAVR
jgi:hypothetical protein